MIYKYLRIVAMLVLLNISLVCVSAANNQSTDIYIDIKPVKDSIKPSEAAEFFIDVYNNLEQKQKFVISGDDIDWSFSTSPARDYTTGFEIKPHLSHRLHLYVKPTNPRPGIYSLSFNLQGESIRKRTFLEVKVVSSAPSIIFYDPNITAKISFPSKVDPRAKQLVKVVVTNNNPLFLEDVDIHIKSRLINEKSKVSIMPNNITSIVFTIDLDDQLTPQTDNLLLDVIYDNKTIASDSKVYEISSYLPLFERNIVSSDSFLYSKKVILLTNTGNVAKKESVRMNVGIFGRFFATSDPKGESAKDGDDYYLVWDVIIGPSETMQIWVYFNYWPIFAVILIHILIFLIYYINKDPFIVTKSAEVGNSHGESVIKVLITVKNKRNKTFKNLRLIDRVPNLIKVEKKTDLGTMAPSKIFKTKNNESILTWNIMEFGSLEEVIFSYKITTSLNIVGKFRLRPAILQIIKNNKKYMIISNDIYVST